MNNILHLLVIHKLPKMYTKVKERWIQIEAEDDELSDDEDSKSTRKKKVVPLWKRLNKDGYTPLTLAAKLGQAEMFSFLLEERKITQWKYGPVSCVLYPLDQVDLEFPDESTDADEGVRRKISMEKIPIEFFFSLSSKMINLLVH